MLVAIDKMLKFKLVRSVIGSPKFYMEIALDKTLKYKPVRGVRVLGSGP